MKDNRCGALPAIRAGTTAGSLQMCLDAIFADREHDWLDQVAPGLSFMMLAGVLMGARDQLRARVSTSEEDDGGLLLEVPARKGAHR